MATKALVVDDEEDYRLIVRTVLEDAGFEVRVAENGVAALKTLESFTPDIVVVDWMMPKLDGEGVCRALRADVRWRELPILMLTVKQTTDDESEALHFGADDFVIKPFAPQELLSRIRALLRRAKPA